jgi:hypothetical protein
MWAMLLLTMEDLEGRRIWVRLGRRAARSRKRPFKVSLLCLSTALWVARLSAVLALRLGFLLMPGCCCWGEEGVSVGLIMGVGFEAGGGLAVADAVVVGPLAKEVFMDIGACGDELPELGVLVVLLWVLLLLLFEFELEAPE